MYDRTLDGETLTFGHEGVLYRNSFVMYDKGSESLWVHVTGEAIKGPKKGSQLRFLPSVIVPWGYWRQEHPETTVLLGEMVEGFMGSFTLQNRLSSYGLSVGEGRDVTLFRYALLAQVPVLNTQVGEEPAVVTFDEEIVLGAAFSTQLGERKLHFDPILELSKPSAAPEEDSASPSAPAAEAPKRAVTTMRDSETGSVWDIRNGRCLRGPLAGERLKPLTATAWLGKRWVHFFPEGKVVGLPKAD